MKKIPVLLASALLLVCVRAQVPAAPAAPDSAKLALAREVIQAMQVDKMFDGIQAQMKQMALQTAANSLPAGATPAQRARAEAFQSKIMELSMAAVKNMTAQMDTLYAEVYSEAELAAMKAFFSSPEGQSMIAKQPQVMQRVMPLAQAMQRDLMPKIQRLVEEAQAEEAKSAAAVSAPEPTPAAKSEPAK